MKRTQRKDALRNIVRQRRSFFSVIVIALLGVAVFLGLDYSAAALERNGSAFYERSNYRDIEILSTRLLTEEDAEAIRALPGTADTESVWQIGAMARLGGERLRVNVISLTERMNLPTLTEGRLPARPGECAVEQVIADEMGWQVGDRIESFEPLDSNGVVFPGESGALITGIADHPDHANTSVNETPYVLVTPDSFDRETMDGCCVKVLAAIEKGPTADRFGKDYLSAAAAALERVEALAPERTALRDEAVKELIQSRLAEADREMETQGQRLAGAEEEISQARRQLTAGEETLAGREEELRDSKTELDKADETLLNTRRKLAESREKLDAARDELAENEKKLEDARTALAEGRQELLDGWDRLEDTKGSIRDALRAGTEFALGDAAASIRWASRQGVDPDDPAATAMKLLLTDTYYVDLNRPLSEGIRGFIYSDSITDDMLRSEYIALTGSDEGFDADEIRAGLSEALIAVSGDYEGEYAALQALCRTWDAGHDRYVGSLAEFREGEAAYETALAEYEAGERDYADGLELYDEGVEERAFAGKIYEFGRELLEEGRVELAEKRQELSAAETELQRGREQYAEARKTVEEARKDAADPEPGRWICYDCRGNASFVQMSRNSGNLRSMEMTFSLLFILLSGMVIYATIGKMVNEQRSLVGAEKAQGLFSREILAKYLLFGVTAAVLGTALGILVARFGLEPFTLRVYRSFFTYDTTKPLLTSAPTLTVLGCALAVSAAAVWAACGRMLRSSAVRLMQPPAPAGRSVTGRNGGHILSLYSRLILLNIRTDIRRVLVTVISVAGCCALVVTGFTLKHAVDRTLTDQFPAITDYDARVSFDPEAEEAVAGLLRENGASYAGVMDAFVTFRVNGVQTAELYAGDAAAIGQYYHLLDWQTGEPMTDPGEGILISRRTAESYSLAPGSELELALGGVKTARVRVTGVFENYIGATMVMSGAAYERAFGEKYRPNMFFVRGGAGSELPAERLGQTEGIYNLTPADADRAMFDSNVSVINALVALFILAAAFMAGAVLLNLTNSYFLQKKRELTIMRVNGFTVREVTGYMLRETAATTGLGIVLGVAGGAGLAYRMIRSMEQPFLQFERGVSIPAWLLGAGITLLFTVIVNVIALRPVARLKLTDIA